jgi:hypothetical protein
VFLVIHALNFLPPPQKWVFLFNSGFFLITYCPPPPPPPLRQELVQHKQGWTQRVKKQKGIIAFENGNEAKQKQNKFALKVVLI